jgi:hypothetical protein
VWNDVSVWGWLARVTRLIIRLLPAFPMLVLAAEAEPSLFLLKLPWCIVGVRLKAILHEAASTVDLPPCLTCLAPSTARYYSVGFRLAPTTVEFRRKDNLGEKFTTTTTSTATNPIDTSKHDKIS